MTRRLLVLLGYGVLAGALALIGYWLIFTAFMVYDDEGYVLWSLRTYSGGSGLYEPVFTQYGPFFYLYYRLLHAVGFAFTNDSGRLITLVYWLAIALTSARLVWRLTLNHAASAAAAALTFVGLVAMIREPIHPGGLIALIVMLAAAGTSEGILRDCPRRFAGIAGLAGGALALIKINVGAFFILAAAGWMLASARRGRVVWLLALGAMIVPRVLMATLWAEAWVPQFALIFACGALGVLTLFTPVEAVAGRPSIADGLKFVAAGIALAAVTIGVVALQGTSLAAIWRGVVTGPLSHPTVYSFPAAWRPGSATGAVFLVLLALLVRARPLQPGALRPVLAGLRIAAACWFLSGAFSAESEGMTRFAFSYGPPLAWLMVIPLSDDRGSPTMRARTWLAWVFVWQTLHAYPVAGSQMAWGTCLWATLVAAGLPEAFAALPGRRAFWAAAGALVLLGGAGLATWRFGRMAHIYYATSPALGLPGAGRLRPPPDTRAELRVIQQNLQAHADVVFSLPGMFSFNIWSDRPTPTDANATHWFSLLSVAEQQGIIDRLEASPRAVLVVHRYLLDFLAKDGFATGGPLRAYLDRNFQRAFTVGYYEFQVHRGRQIAPLSTATYHATSPAHIDLVLAPTNGQPIASIAVTPLDDSTKTIRSFQPTPASPWTLQLLHLDGTPAGPPSQLTSPSPITALAQLTIPVPIEADFTSVQGVVAGPRTTNAPPIPTPGQFILRNPAGAEITAAYLLR